MTDFEAPDHWTKNAAYITQTRYARPNEHSVEQIINRMVEAWRAQGAGNQVPQGYQWNFFTEKITQDLLKQKALPNSPQWFNTGVVDKPQVHACFINEVEDNLDSISDLWKKETRIFRNGSGSGTNVSSVREKGAPLSGGGTSSGVLSFLKVGNANAGAIKSGGTTRRAALMRILDDDHPDLEEFITWKGREEEKVKWLVEGSDGKLDYDWRGEAYATVDGQNSNNSVMVTDDFMHAAIHNKPWTLKSRVLDGEDKEVQASDLLDLMAKEAWKSGDPGIMFFDTINHDNTAANDGDIVSSNPCCFVGDTMVDTSWGHIYIEVLAELSEKGLDLPQVRTPDRGYQVIKKAWCSGRTKTLTRVVVQSEEGYDYYYCTPDHVWVVDGVEYEAKDLGQVPATSEYSYRVKEMSFTNPQPVYDLEVDTPEHLFCLAGVYNEGPTVHNSEYLFLNNTACNLASINVAAVYRDVEFNMEDFWGELHAITQRWITILDISIDLAGYPTKEFEEKTKEYRTLGLGIMGLHELLIMRDLKYDSDEGRAFAGEIMSYMRSSAIMQSVELARTLGPAPAFERNAVHMRELYQLAPTESMRNFQLLAIAPTGTISLVADCLSSGCEPIFARQVTKELSGGDSISFKYPDDVETAGELSPEAHLKMVAALQPYVCGGISKTINMPQSSTWEDIRDIYVKAWEMGLKAVSIYRDGSKSSQPMNDTSKKGEETSTEVVTTTPFKTVRTPLPSRRTGYTKRLEMAGQSLYIRTGEYEDGRLGEVFIDISKDGSTLGGFMRAFAKALSIGLQYGIPLEDYIKSYRNTKFEPSGMVYDHEELHSATSLIDLVVQDLEYEYITRPRTPAPQEEVIVTNHQVSNYLLMDPVDDEPSYEHPPCTNCLSMNLVRTGTCFTCQDCGETTGCA